MCNQVRAISILQSQEFVHEHPGGCTAEQVTIGVPRTGQRLEQHADRFNAERSAMHANEGKGSQRWHRI